MKIETFSQFQIGFLFSITKWHKGEREIVLSLPFIDLCIKQVQKKYKTH